MHQAARHQHEGNLILEETYTHTAVFLKAPLPKGVAQVIPPRSPFKEGCLYTVCPGKQGRTVEMISIQENMYQGEMQLNHIIDGNGPLENAKREGYNSLFIPQVACSA
eukprot:1821004-Amphidinium_carterae.1